MSRLSKSAVRELAFAGSLILLGALVSWDTHRMEVPQGNTIVSPRAFPYFIAIFVMLTGIGLIISILRGNEGVPEGTEAGDPYVKSDYKTMLLLMAAIGVHVVLLEKAGYVIAATLGFWGVAYAFGSRKPLKDFAISLAFAYAVYITFTKGLQISLPAGPFEVVVNAPVDFLTAVVNVLKDQLGNAVDFVSDSIRKIRGN